MCTTCGCSEDAKATVTELKTGTTHTVTTHVHHHHSHSHAHEHPGDPHARNEHPHAHDHSHAHEHRHEHVHRTTVSLEADVLARNNRLAERNRGWFEGRNILALNLLSSPGAGKTTLLERTIRDLAGEIPISVVEGDQETSFDAERIQATGCKTVQINTGTGCHL
ncbi:MAG: GTP-binding protein, partial [Gammaproteobacteria bacterium]